ncbi:MAG: endonuclease/exonuclease/phosphatase family protein [Desulforhopalus sp.]
MHLTIATYNIHSSVGTDGIENPERIATVLGEVNADIVALQEVSASDGEAADVLTYLAQTTGMTPIEGYTLGDAETRYGNGLLSRLTVSTVNRLDISVNDREPRGVIKATFEVRSQKMQVWATHLGLGIRERKMQIKELLKNIQANKSDTDMLLGDFNEWLPWGNRLRELNRFFKASPSPATFPSRLPLLKLDRIWVRPGNRLLALRAHSSKLSRLASDHLPLVARVFI